MEQRVGPRLLICRLLDLRMTSSDEWNIITAKLSQKSKLKLQILAETVIISTNPTTYPPGQESRKNLGSAVAILPGKF